MRCADVKLMSTGQVKFSSFFQMAYSNKVSVGSSASEELFGLNIPDGISVEEVRAILSNVGTVLSHEHGFGEVGAPRQACWRVRLQCSNRLPCHSRIVKCASPSENQTAAEEEASVIRQGEITLHNNRFELIQGGVP